MLIHNLRKCITIAIYIRQGLDQLGAKFVLFLWFIHVIKFFLKHHSMQQNKF